VAEYPPFHFEAFHVQWYPYHVSAALELPPPAPPPGVAVPTEPTAVVAMREQYETSLPETMRAFEEFARARRGTDQLKAPRGRKRRLLGGSR
jgi:hypothetical protein